MSINVKLVNAYAKSLFQKLNTSKSSIQKTESFNLSKITSVDSKNFSTDLSILGEELLLIRALFISSKKLKEFFKNPTYLEQQKLDVILTIFPGLTITMKSFLKVLTERNHLSLIPEISEEFNKYLLNLKNSKKVKIITSSPLEENLGSLLLTTLKKITNGKEIILKVAYNPKLLGGLILEYNSVAIDASILKEFSLFFNEI